MKINLADSSVSILAGSCVLPSARVSIPLVSSLVQAGFPSPAEDYIEAKIDLNRELIKHPEATFCVRATGDSMINEGIFAGTVLLVDRMIEAESGDVIIARIGDEMCVKELLIDKEKRVFLVSKNENYKPIEIKPSDDFEIWGKVVCAINLF